MMGGNWIKTYQWTFLRPMYRWYSTETVTHSALSSIWTQWKPDEVEKQSITSPEIVIVSIKLIMRNLHCFFFANSSFLSLHIYI